MSDSQMPRPDRRALPAGDDGLYELERRAATGLLPADLMTVHQRPSRGEAHLLEHWRIVLRHRWIVLAFLLSTLLATAAWTFLSRPVFSATAILRIEKEEPRVVKFEDVVKTDTTEDYYQTQYQVLQSRSLAAAVVAALHLAEHPEFQDRDRGVVERARGWINRQLQRLGPAPPPVETAAREELGVVSPVTDYFLSRLVVEPIRSSRLVRLSFESYHPDIAARVANALADTFIARQLQDKTGATRYASEFLGKQLDEAGQRLEQAETRLQAFLRDNNIFFLNDSNTRTGEQQDLVTQQMSQLSDALLKARAERIGKESLYSQAVGHDGASVPAVLASPVVARLKEELAKSEAEYRRLEQIFKPEYPRMEQLQRSIDELRAQITQESVRILDGLDADYQAAVRAEQQLQAAIDGHQKLAKSLGAKLPQYSVLRRDVDTNRQIYISLLTRLKETQVSSALITSNISSVDRAEIPITPSRPRKTLNLILGLLVGVFGGVALAFLVEYLDTTVKDPNDIQAVLRVPALGFVPVLRASALGVATRAALMDDRARHGRALGRDRRGRRALATGSENDPVFAEAFRTLRTTLLYCAADNAPTTFMVTSPQRGEGKTTIASNLAIALAQHGAGDVLVIDADLRRPTLHKVFGVAPTPGFANFLADEGELADIVQPTATDKLYVVPAGRTLSTLADLLASPRLAPALEVLSDRFKHIVFDTTPLFGISDALSLAPHVGGALLVLRHGHAHRETARRAVNLLATVGTPFLGAVLNRFDPRTARDGYYQSLGYGVADPGVIETPGRRARSARGGETESRGTTTELDA
jgi:capsular exopolysaccharide synthesis family protein